MVNGTSIQEEKIGFVFDLDGTILDDVKIFTDLPFHLAELYKIDLSEAKLLQLKKTLIEGLSKPGGKSLMKDLILKMADEFGIPRYKKPGFLLRIYKKYKQNLPNIKLNEGTMDTLHVLAHDYSASIGIQTASSVKETKQKCERFPGLLDIFKDNIVGRDSVKLLKPSPEGILNLSAKWGIPPNKLVMIGDMNNDVLTGRNAGAVTIGVLSGFSDLEQMQQFNPDFIIQSVAEIPKIMNDLMKLIKNT
jgi:phosphoglycolate phosphatase-like HAD superfamily hydrolase